MGVVVAMTSRKPARTYPPHIGGAEILFFTGVRYYRMPDDLPAPAPARKPRGSPKAKPESSTRRHG